MQIKTMLEKKWTGEVANPRGLYIKQYVYNTVCSMNKTKNTNYNRT
jgi:hypothetical protein